MRELTTPLSDRFTDADAERLAGVMKALAHPNRLHLLHLLRDGERPAGALIAELVGVGQPTVSHHLKVLLGAGLATRRWERKGSVPRSFYTLTPGALAVVGWALLPGGTDA